MGLAASWPTTWAWEKRSCLGRRLFGLCLFALWHLAREGEGENKFGNAVGAGDGYILVVGVEYALDEVEAEAHAVAVLAA